VVDDLGIYFDPTKPSRLEVLLQQQDVSDAERRRAVEVMKLLRDNRISKYSVSSNCNENESVLFPGNQKGILVIGQVQGDASLIYGADAIKTNRQLLTTVRAENPGAYVVYKPHPDVVSGNRTDGLESSKSAVCETNELYDHIETDVSIEVALEQCDEVHTITSLAGFEALLCGCKVVTYGKPFYAGWGLTEDRSSFDKKRSHICRVTSYCCKDL